MAREAVYLNVYSKKWVSDYFWSLGVGVYHTGIEVYGTEYCFGWHWRPISGIFEIEPKCEEEVGDDYKFKQSIMLGYTDFTRADVVSIVNQMGEDFQGRKYHLMNKNCNHFTDSLAKVLCGKEIPGWVNRLAYITSCIPFIERAVPRTWLIPVAPQGCQRVLDEADEEDTADEVTNYESARKRESDGQRSRRPNSGTTPNTPRQLLNNVIDFFNR